MITKIDINSEEFKSTFEKTVKFTDKVCAQFGFEYNPISDVVHGVQQGLTRNKMMNGKRFCPCFMYDPADTDPRICPCKPALEEEIPTDGTCHCQIFCTPEYAANLRAEENMEEIAHDHSRGLTKDECELLLQKRDIDAEELISLLEARSHGTIDFKLLDVREWMEYNMGHIKGIDHLVPTSSFFAALEDANIPKETPIIVSCQVGGRSAQVQNMMYNLEYKQVINLSGGYASYHGETER
jgi:rhodanese-related sulfurtransferase/ferredoxin-thioredoxin reductase catalytic subunit